MSVHNIKFDINNHLTEATLLHYKEGKMNMRDMHQVELHLLECDLCSEALEGFELLASPRAKESVKEIKSLLSEKIETQKNRFTFSTLGIAASVLLLLSFALYFLINNTLRNSGNNLAKRQETTAPPAYSPDTNNSANNSKNSIYSSDTNISSTSGLAYNKSEELTEKEVSNRNPQIQKDKDYKKLKIEDEPFASIAEAEGESLRYEKESLAQTDEAPNSIISESEESFKTKPNQQAVVAAPTASGESERSISRAKSGLPEIVSGKVAAEDGRTLPGVKVEVKGTSIGTITDSKGNYSVKVPAPNSTLVFSSRGYTPIELQVQEKDNQLYAVLTPEMNTSHPIVLIEPKRKKKSNIPESPAKTDARPEGGVNEFYKYVSEKVNYPDSAKINAIFGDVIIEFSVNPDKRLSDFTIIKSIGYGLEEEAIRLITEGPFWNPGMSNGEPIRQRVRIKIPFKLK